MDMMDCLKQEINKSRKAKNATRLFYYEEALRNKPMALVSFETFQGSWAFDGWFAARREQITAFIDEQKRRFFVDYAF